jgi:hypothetical protein
MGYVCLVRTLVCAWSEGFVCLVRRVRVPGPKGSCAWSEGFVCLVRKSIFENRLTIGVCDETWRLHVSLSVRDVLAHGGCVW